ncbi:MAG: sugar transferase [Rhodocyclales bacterium CG17_big_fil_post_rev_8_21_14_2_50_68_7]|nr:MAG: sugar transferase [Rhodocyclales bacterium CG17_big_fil_post_rev_8_21_14_2_50_68_7]PIX75408.1 MAG: sugar transferase [Rhodocyclales bacterium CG_4_10_14_3_um_filter_68_10]
MSDPVLFLAHRLPFPPNKGDKLRSYRLLRHLAAGHDVFLGTFVDDPADRIHLDTVRTWCAEAFIADLVPWRARLRSLRALASGGPLSLPYYLDSGLRAWVRRVVGGHGIRRAFVFSSPMAQYVSDLPGLDCVVDFVDIDSDKWRQYAQARRWPMSSVFRREAARLLAAERDVAAASRVSLFVTEAEAELFRRLAPESAARVFALNNGVDGRFFRPDAGMPSPYAADEIPIAFTGAMDYWPNVDAVCWFADEVLPAIRAREPHARFHVVGMNPAPQVQALAQRPGVAVSGRVPDVRPYLQHARAVVAPLRIARGIQNKVLEAMAMARPVVASPGCAGPLGAAPGREIEVARSAGEFAARTLAVLEPARAASLGAAARARVLADYDWEAHLRRFDRLLDGWGEAAPQRGARAARGTVEALA